MAQSSANWLAETRRKVRATQLSTISQLQEEGGPVAVQGTAVARGLLASPLSGVSAIGYRVFLEAHDQAGKARNFDISRLVDFDLQDAAGDRIRVRTGDCELVLQHEYTLDSHDAGGSTGFAAMKLLAEHAGRDFFRGSEPKLRWHEFFLQPRETCYVRGNVRLVIDTSREAVGYRENAREPTLVAASDGRMLIADLSLAQLTSYLDQWARVSGT